MEHTVSRFPAAAFALILGLVAALAVVMTLSIGGWGLSIPGPSSGSNAVQPAAQTQPQSPATESRPTTVAPDAPSQPAGQAGVYAIPQDWGPGVSTSP